MARYTSTNLFRISHMEKVESEVKFATRTADFDVWVVIIGALITLKNAVDEKLHLPAIGDQYFLTVFDYPS